MKLGLLALAVEVVWDADGEADEFLPGAHLSFVEPLDVEPLMLAVET